MITHLRHMAKVRPQGSDRQATQWALDEIERLQGLLAYGTDTDAYQKLRAENERLRDERDEELARLQNLNIEHRRENERLRAALQKVADLPTSGLPHHKGDSRLRAHRIAVAALGTYVQKADGS